MRDRRWHATPVAPEPRIDGNPPAPQVRSGSRPPRAAPGPHGGSPAAALATAALLALACGAGPTPPAALDTVNDSCRFCRMAVYSQKTAGQIVAPGEEPAFFDDLGCLRDHLAGDAKIPPGAVAYVADHRSKEWVRAAAALYTRQPRLDTPMGSHLIAHADAASRDADAEAAGGERLTAGEVFGPAAVPDG